MFMHGNRMRHMVDKHTWLKWFSSCYSNPGTWCTIEQ